MSIVNLLPVMAMMLLPLASTATVWRVNNQGFSAHFIGTNALQDAINSIDVFPYDTLHIEASPINYPSATLNQPLHLIGPGYLLDENPGLQHAQLSAKISGLTIESTAIGSSIQGLQFTNAGVDIEASNIVFERNYVSGGDLHFIGNGVTWNNIVISGNYLSGIISNTLFSATNVIIHNNIIVDATLYDLVSGEFFNNTLIETGGAESLDVHNFNIYNNIVRTGAVVTNNNNIHHNLCGTPNCLPAGNNNQEDVPIATVLNLTSTTEGDFQLLDYPGNPAYGSGESGADLGAFAGPTPYVLSGIPGIPTIYELHVPGVAFQGDPLNVTLSTRSND